MEQQRQWWNRRWLLAALVALAAVPLLWPTVPPLVDLPGHMARYRVQLDYSTYRWLDDWYAFKWSLIGNLGIDLLIEPLGRLLGLELAVKLIVIAIPVLTVSGLLWIAREVHGHVPATALFALPIAYSYPFHFGFANFALSMALALNAFALWLRLGRQHRIRLRAVIFVPLSCLIWLCHTYGWGVLGVLAFSGELVRQRDLGRSWFKAWFRAIPHCLLLALPMVLMAMWRGGQHVSGQTADWFNWGAKVAWMVMMLRDRWMAFDIASVAVLLLILLKGIRDPKIQYSRNLTLSALFLIAVYILLPRIVFGSAYADMRLAPYLAGIAVLALRPRPGLSMRGASLLAAAGLVFFGARMAATTASLYLYDRSWKHELTALDHVPVGARLVSFVGVACRNVWYGQRFEHLPAFALERRLAFSNDQWSMAGAQLLTVRYRAAQGFAHDPSQLATLSQCPYELWRPISKALATFPRNAFDYVWLINPPHYDPALVRGMTPIWRSGTSVLYRIDDHTQPAPLSPS
ncbi:hypothetical protein DFR49_3788 [Hephaestia caeni]|uniref:Glucosyltransferase GtrII-like protein n=1 Tax=Hephaestia caeni TaxID=645617 RepID=A0A397NQE2_9SPHN|nr:hypothetical protein [Hephaestia caeni]RIA37899.1 hypothetical protein DFR49_3788 [Hephaestia caeni]